MLERLEVVLRGYYYYYYYKNYIPSVVNIQRVKSYKNLKTNSWMAKGPGQRHSQTTHAAKLR